MSFTPHPSTLVHGRLEVGRGAEQMKTLKGGVYEMQIELVEAHVISTTWCTKTLFEQSLNCQAGLILGTHLGISMIFFKGYLLHDGTSLARFALVQLTGALSDQPAVT